MLHSEKRFVMFRQQNIGKKFHLVPPVLPCNLRKKTLVDSTDLMSNGPSTFDPLKIVSKWSLNSQGGHTRLLGRFNQ
ncbi:hypothetical protein N7486_011394 [Penicillium sp. IBT 16267x]|nr:hypothetical protein N7486_011394 [Penicillium sp. IBT 16267x]